MLRIASVVLGAALVAMSPAMVSPALAQGDTTLRAAAPESVNAVSEVICRRIAPPTGSRIGPRNICKTQHEWDLINRESRTVVEEAQYRSKFTSGN